MAGTYEMIKALSGKGTDWHGLLDALISKWLDVYAGAHNGAVPWEGNTTDVWNAAKGVGALRRACMEVANSTVGAVATRAVFIPASEETRAWGGFLGGETVVVREHDAEESMIEEIAEIIKKFA